MVNNPKKSIPRTAAGLRDACFEMLEKLLTGDIDSGDAIAFSKVGRLIVQSAELQLQFEKERTVNAVPQHLSDMHLVPPLTFLTEKKDEK